MGVLDEKLAALVNTFNQVIETVKVLKPQKKDQPNGPAGQPFSSMSPDFANDAARRLREAAGIGDISELVSIAEELKFKSEAFAPYREKIVRLADNFDFDGILKLAEEMEKLG
jgi:hypothetical protein